jgi:hypothetical protein
MSPDAEYRGVGNGLPGSSKHCPKHSWAPELGRGWLEYLRVIVLCGIYGMEVDARGEDDSVRGITTNVEHLDVGRHML